MIFGRRPVAVETTNPRKHLAMTRRRGLCILLGAGASVDAGLPVSTQILTEFREYLKHDREDGTPYWCRSGKPWWPAPNIPEMDGVTRLVDSFRSTDIENLMRKLQHESGRRSHDPLYSASYQAASQFIYWRLRTPPRSSVTYFRRLLDLLTFATRSPLIVATLNWDCCVERALGWQIVSTGFDQSGRRTWTGVFRTNKPIWLLKLHGSLSWVDYSWRDMDAGLPSNLVSFDTPTEQTGTRYNEIAQVALWLHESKWEQSRARSGQCIRSPVCWPRNIIFGPEDLKTYHRSLAMFPSLRRRFATAVRSSKVLLSIGFSWRDGWVNDLVRQGEADGLSVIDVRPARRRRRPWRTSSGRLRLPFAGREALQGSRAVVLEQVQHLLHPGSS